MYHEAHKVLKCFFGVRLLVKVGGFFMCSITVTVRT